MKILVAIDGSKHSEVAVDEVARRHCPAMSEVRIISVVEPPFSYSGVGNDMQPFSAMEGGARERARAEVEAAAAKCRAHAESRQLRVTSDVLAGSAKAVILEQAESFGADLIVVGSHGHGMLERFLLGSVSQSIALHAKCSVEIVRGQKSMANQSNQQV